MPLGVGGGQQLLEPGLRSLQTEGNGRAGGIKSPQQQIHIRDGQGASFAIAGGAGIRSRTLWAHRQSLRSEMADGSAASGDGLYGNAGAQQGDAAHSLAKAVSHRTVQSRHIGAGATHVEGDDAGVAQPLGSMQCPKCASGGAAQQQVLWLNGGGGLQAAALVMRDRGTVSCPSAMGVATSRMNCSTGPVR